MHVMTIPVAVGMLTAAVLVVTMLGSATNDRRQAGTAADAAALAAAQEWNEHLGLLHGLHLGASEPGAFWGIAEEALLGPDLEEEMNEAARAYAERNGAELVDEPEIDPARLQVTARVRHDESVPGTEIRSEATATAGVTLRGGLCLGGEGLGWLIDGLCLTEPEPEEEDPAEGGAPGDPDDGGAGEDPGGDPGDGGDEGGGGDEEGDDEPAWTPPDVDGYSSAVVLVD
jgi:hypothetical protein